jgi:hypothetical protein
VGPHPRLSGSGGCVGLSGWLIAILGAVGTLLLAMVKADLQDAKVCRWLARHLVYQAALCLPRGERARWREEAISNLLDLPGRLPPLLWALDTYVHAGSWGRMRGAPSRLQILVARIRMAWQRLRSVPTARARARAQQLHPASIQAQAQVAQVMTIAADATMVAVGTTRSSGVANLKPPREGYEMWAGQHRGGQMHLSDQDFVVWLAQERRDFEDDLDRNFEEYQQRRDRELGL